MNSSTLLVRRGADGPEVNFARGRGAALLPARCGAHVLRACGEIAADTSERAQREQANE
jgi:hypothetical protein